MQIQHFSFERLADWVPFHIFPIFNSCPFTSQKQNGVIYHFKFNTNVSGLGRKKKDGLSVMQFFLWGEMGRP